MRRGGLLSEFTDARMFGAVDCPQMQESEPLRGLREDHRSFVFPFAVLFLVWCFVQVLPTAFTRAFMAQRVWADIAVGFPFVLGRFVTTVAIAMAYAAFANRRLAPQSARIRETLEGTGSGA